MRIALHGFGRIGRAILRQLVLDPRNADIDVHLINDIADPETLAYLFRYDSTFGPFPGRVALDGASLIIGARRFDLTRQREARDLSLADVDVLLDCTGLAHSQAQAGAGLAAGAARVLVSGPCDGAEATVILGANEADLTHQRVVSNGSCTTNAIAPLLRSLHETWGIAQGHVTTVHCYTNSQPLIDAPRATAARSRGAAVSMIPTTTSATDLTTRVLPALAGRITGAALRVPTPSVSCIDAVLTLERDLPGGDALRQCLTNNPVIDWTDEPVVSSDMRGQTASLIVAGPETRRLGTRHLRVFGWYDNEWGFAARMIDMARRMGPC